MIKNNKTEEVFWSCRLDFITEAEVIYHVVPAWMHCERFNAMSCRLFSLLGHIEIILGAVTCSLLRFIWFTFGVVTCGLLQHDYVEIVADRFVSVFLNSIRFILGAVTCGLLWPHGFRKWLWDSSIEKDNQSTYEIVRNLLHLQRDNRKDVWHIRSDVERISMHLLHIQRENLEVLDSIKQIKEDLNRISQDRGK
jgi:hypothetical protein